MGENEDKKNDKPKGPAGPIDDDGDDDDIKILEIVGFDGDVSQKMTPGEAEELDIKIEGIQRETPRDEGLENENRELKEKLLRRLAEFENYKKRVQREKEEYTTKVYLDVIRGLLPILDSFDRAMKEPSPEDSFREGVELIFAQFKGFLEKEGLVEIEADGESFDPNMHEAMMLEEDSDLPEGRIVDVFEKGYTFRGKLVRPAKVKVTGGKSETAVDSDDTETNGSSREE